MDYLSTVSAIKLQEPNGVAVLTQNNSAHAPIAKPGSNIAISVWFAVLDEELGDLLPTTALIWVPKAPIPQKK